MIHLGPFGRNAVTTIRESVADLRYSAAGYATATLQRRLPQTSASSLTLTARLDRRAYSPFHTAPIHSTPPCPGGATAGSTSSTPISRSISLREIGVSIAGQMQLSLGIDLASQNKKTAACFIEWRSGAASARLPVSGPPGEDVDWPVGLSRQAQWVGIDAPFGWPEAAIARLTR
jgi:Protein of unknown function (DUF429)